MHKSIRLLGLLALGVTPLGQAADNDVKWNGYINLVGGILKEAPVSDTTSNKQYPNYRAYENRFTAMQDSSFALQVSKSLNDRLMVTGQMIARGSEEEFKTAVSWAYITYDINDASSLRVGRLGLPTFYYSDFVDVGMAYNWVTPPAEVYDFAVYYNGANYLRHDTLAGTDLTTELFTGSGDQTLARPDGTTSAIKVRDMWGGSITDTVAGWLTFRLMYEESQTSATTNVDIAAKLAPYNLPQSLVDSASSDAMSVINAAAQIYKYANVSVKAEQGPWYLMAEGMKLDSHSDKLTEVGFRRWYVSTGVRVKSVIYHLTYARAEDDLFDVSNLFSNPVSQGLVSSIKTAGSRDAKSWTLGARIDTTRTTALKFELIQFEELASSVNEKSGIGKNMLLRAAFNASF